MIMNQIINSIKEYRKIAITFHTSPDGDSLGSSLALMQGLRDFGKDAYIVCKETISETYSWLPYANEIDGNCGDITEETDCIIVLDCGNLERINMISHLKDTKVTTINIDHHLSNDLYGDLNYVDTNSAAVGEIVYQILQLMNIKITKDIAKCLYTSILTDTGSFRHSNTTSITHSIAGDLINTGIDFSEIHRLLFDNKKFERIKLQGKVIEDMHLALNSKVSIVRVTKDMFNSLGIEECDTGDLVSIGLKIDTVDVSVLIKEKDDITKVSLRSKKIVDVRKIAESFGGGGHIRAAGFAVKDSVLKTEENIIKALQNELV